MASTISGWAASRRSPSRSSATTTRSGPSASARVAADLAASRLAPLAELPDGPRARLTETLAAWLDRPGQVQAVAAALDVHPQTVRYRVARLRELFGERLEDPDARFDLMLALRAYTQA